MSSGNEKEREKNASRTDLKIPGGYYIKARQIKNSWIAHSAPVVREVWDYLLREANHKNTKYDGFIMKRGQLFRKYPDIRDELSWNIGYRKEQYSEDQMKHAMKLLRNHQMITLSKQPRGCLITVLNYDRYQAPSNYEYTTEYSNEYAINPPLIHQSSPSINKNDKKEKNEENIYAEFEIFWNQYHLITGLAKTDIAPAKKYWNRMSNTEKEKAIENIQFYFSSLNDKKFCKKARTYLSDKNYNDEFKQSSEINNLMKGAL